MTKNAQTQEPSPDARAAALRSPNGYLDKRLPTVIFHADDSHSATFKTEEKLRTIPENSKVSIIVPRKITEKLPTNTHLIPYVSLTVDENSKLGEEYAVATALAGTEPMNHAVALHVLVIHARDAKEDNSITNILQASTTYLRQISHELEGSPMFAHAHVYEEAAAYLNTLFTAKSSTAVADINEAIQKHCNQLAATTEKNMAVAIAKRPNPKAYSVVVLPTNQTEPQIENPLSGAAIITSRSNTDLQTLTQRADLLIENIVLHNTKVEPAVVERKRVEPLPTATASTDIKPVEVPASVVSSDPKPKEAISVVEAMAELPPEKSYQAEQEGAGRVIQLEVDGVPITIALQHDGNIADEVIAKRYADLLNRALQMTQKSSPIKGDVRKKNVLAVMRTPETFLQWFPTNLKQLMKDDPRYKDLPQISFSFYYNVGENDCIGIFGPNAQMHQVDIATKKSIRILPRESDGKMALKQKEPLVWYIKSEKNIAYLLYTTARSPLTSNEIWAAVTLPSNRKKRLATLVPNNLKSYAIAYIPPEDTEVIKEAVKAVSSKGELLKQVSSHLKITADAGNSKEFDTAAVKQLKGYVAYLNSFFGEKINIGGLAVDTSWIMEKFPIMNNIQKLVGLVDIADDAYIRILQSIDTKLLESAYDWIDRLDKAIDQRDLPPEFYENFRNIIDIINRLQSSNSEEREPELIVTNKIEGDFSPNTRHFEGKGEGVVARQYSLGAAQVDLLIHADAESREETETIEMILNGIFEKRVKELEPLIKDGLLSFETEIGMLMEDLDKKLEEFGITASFGAVFRGNLITYLVTSGQTQQAWEVRANAIEQQQKQTKELGTRTDDETFTVRVFDNAEIDRSGILFTSVSLTTNTASEIKKAMDAGNITTLVPNTTQQYGLLYIPPREVGNDARIIKRERSRLKDILG